jgi:hypothetical protein
MGHVARIMETTHSRFSQLQALSLNNIRRSLKILVEFSSWLFHIHVCGIRAKDPPSVFIRKSGYFHQRYQRNQDTMPHYASDDMDSQHRELKNVSQDSQEECVVQVSLWLNEAIAEAKVLCYEARGPDEALQDKFVTSFPDDHVVTSDSAGLRSDTFQGDASHTDQVTETLSTNLPTKPDILEHNFYYYGLSSFKRLLARTNRHSVPWHHLSLPMKDILHWIPPSLRRDWDRRISRAVQNLLVESELDAVYVELCQIGYDNESQDSWTNTLVIGFKPDQVSWDRAAHLVAQSQEIFEHFGHLDVECEAFEYE